MSFTVEDFHDLIELLAQHPEWRAELRRHVLSDELLDLPAQVQRLIDAQARTDVQIAELVSAQRRSEARLEKVEARLEGVETRLGRVETRLNGMNDKLGELDGDVMELHYVRRGLAYLSPIARRLRAVDTSQLAELLEEAVDAGQITDDERGAVMLADVVFTGRRRVDGQEVYLLAEVSSGVGTHDVERAAERAALLQKLGRPVLPVVAGRWINDEAAELAHTLGVWYAQGGVVTAPRTA